MPPSLSASEEYGSFSMPDRQYGIELTISLVVTVLDDFRIKYVSRFSWVYAFSNYELKMKSPC